MERQKEKQIQKNILVGDMQTDRLTGRQKRQAGRYTYRQTDRSQRHLYDETGQETKYRQAG